MLEFRGYKTYRDKSPRQEKQSHHGDGFRGSTVILRRLAYPYGDSAVVLCDGMECLVKG